MRYYVLQKHNFGIGNFINCTPTIRHVAEHFEEPVPVLFQLPHVAEMYRDTSYIMPVDDPGSRILLFGSNTINQQIPDSQFIYNKVKAQLGMKDWPMHPTHVDRCPKPQAIIDEIGDDRYCVIVRGTAENEFSVPGYTERKDPGDDIYRHIIHTIKKDMRIVFIGTDADYKRWIGTMGIWCFEQPGIFILNDIRASLGALRFADLVIANDSGMYHAAGAMNKRMLVLWKDTAFEKNKSPGKNITFAMKGNWMETFSTFYE